MAFWREGLRRREACPHTHSGSAVLGSGMALGLLTWKGEGTETVDVCRWIYRPLIYPYCQGNRTTGLSHSEWEGCTWHLWWSQPLSPWSCRYMLRAFTLALAHTGRLSKHALLASCCSQSQPFQAFPGPLRDFPPHPAPPSLHSVNSACVIQSPPVSLYVPGLHGLVCG